MRYWQCYWHATDHDDAIVMLTILLTRYIDHSLRSIPFKVYDPVQSGTFVMWVYIRESVYLCCPHSEILFYWVTMILTWYCPWCNHGNRCCDWLVDSCKDTQWLASSHFWSCSRGKRSHQNRISILSISSHNSNRATNQSAKWTSHCLTRQLAHFSTLGGVSRGKTAL